jgi:hypothetical protein
VARRARFAKRKNEAVKLFVNMSAGSCGCSIIAVRRLQVGAGLDLNASPKGTLPEIFCAAGFGSGTDRKCVTDKDGGKAVGMASCRSLSQSTLATS